MNWFTLWMHLKHKAADDGAVWLGEEELQLVLLACLTAWHQDYLKAQNAKLRWTITAAYWALYRGDLDSLGTILGEGLSPYEKQVIGEPA